MKSLLEIPRGCTNAYIQLKDRTIFPINLEYIRYDSKIDLDNLMYVEFGENGDFDNLPTINQLLEDNLAVSKPYVREADVCYKTWPTKISYPTIMRKFRKQGFNVTEEAIRHNFEAWQKDLKSGYLDKENGYFLFTPCKLNPLSFNATKLDKHFEEWQMTYEF
jgi:hypothetical protein